MGFADRHRHWLRAYQHCTRGQPSWFAFRDWQIGSQFTNRTRQPDASRLVAVEAGAVAVRLSELRVRYRRQNVLDDDI